MSFYGVYSLCFRWQAPTLLLAFSFLQAGTRNYSNNHRVNSTLYCLQVGLGVACEYVVQQGIQNIWQRIQELSELLRTGLRQIPGVQLQDVGEVLCGVISFTVVRCCHPYID